MNRDGPVRERRQHPWARLNRCRPQVKASHGVTLMWTSAHIGMLRLTNTPATPRSRYVRSTLLVGTLVGVASLCIANAASAEPKTGPGSVRVTRDVKDPRWLHGSVDVGAPADEVLLRLQKVDQWQALLSDIKQLKVKSTSTRRDRIEDHDLRFA